ncbi:MULTISPECIES: DUF1538 domain-containing protein [Shewanella]|uniref:DUF1538 domain-containing protein n=1 Tax=Shewanella vesiculosa TaxID=518738 RepID=A0ABV0FLZ7_9GAMM|nr:MULTISPECIES: DUF1538 domain-containing protein [Shewanella]NCQ43651.1 DUF1538 domain-containing protein [Shewanella frigidimarina]MBB1321740.1 DUF1538 domain-containing protein [Shewanella sp. SR43-8]MBB1388442.1 DUF1538 domain-containing protein [Shewanella sp. SG44-6]NCO70025.1 DUF1538 domain-containing protein [Shewanella vesiculosa]NCP35565.1 DUF1538 domain-containing protein [Shewanella vesiculosa]|tara:strand:+ start:994 stop:1746 length:753 start_codon:yes stop_codon:yes gene_type:complete
MSTLLLTARDVIPIAVILFGFQLGVLKRPVSQWRKVLLGFVYVIIGLTFFLVGLQLALFPIGESMANQLTTSAFLHPDGNNTPFIWQDYFWVYVFAAAIGFSTTIAEPSLIAVAIKANQVSGGTIGIQGLRMSVALGVAIGITLGCFRIVVGDPIHYYIMAGYVVVVIQTFYAPKMIVPLAYDSGGVTTSTVTVPLVAALGLGLATNVEGRNPLIDGFGLIAFASLFPMITVMGYAQVVDYLSKRKAIKE